MYVIRDKSSYWTPRADSRTRCAPQYAGVPNPLRVLNSGTSGLEEVSAVISCLVMVCCCYSSIVIAGRGSHIPSRIKLFLLRGPHFHTFWLIFRIFYIILSICVQNHNLERFFPILYDFWSSREDFGWFLELFCR